MYAGEWTGTMALTEPHAGSGLGDLTSSATPIPGREGAYKIRGSKIFISGADRAHFGLVFARTDAEKGRGGITCFLVDTDMKGFHVRRIVHTLRSMHNLDVLMSTAGDVGREMWNRCPLLGPGEAIVTSPQLKRPVVVAIRPAQSQRKFVR